MPILTNSRHGRAIALTDSDYIPIVHIVKYLNISPHFFLIPFLAPNSPLGFNCSNFSFVIIISNAWFIARRGYDFKGWAGLDRMVAGDTRR